MGQAKDNGHPPQPSLGAVASELESEIGAFEALTRRVSKLELGTKHQLAKMGDLLAQAETSHKRFIDRLRALILAIDDARARQNASAAALSACADRLDAQRKLCAALEQRFAELGEAARAVGTLVQEFAAGPAAEKLAAASERLKASIDAAHSLVDDARSAGLSDLEQQADAIRQQLQSLAKKLERAESAL